MDDAWAIFTILRAHEAKAVKLVGITCVDGNTKLDNVVVNVTRTLKAGNALDVSHSRFHITAIKSFAL